jgi:hypothetical protein
LLSVIGVATAASVVGQEVFRRLYYGAWVPNTYALKVGGVPLTTRAARGGRAVVYTALVGGAVFVILAAVAWYCRRDRRSLALPLMLAAATSAYCVVVGGDAWEWMRYADRYVTPALPLLACAAAVGAADLVDRYGDDARLRLGLLVGTLAVAGVLVANVLPRGAGFFAPGAGSGIDERFIALAPVVFLGALLAPSIARRWARRDVMASTALFVGILAFAPWVPAQLHWLTLNGVHVDDDAGDAQLGVEFDAVTAPQARIAVFKAGNEIYFARRTGIDLLGKSDPRIAHLPPNSRMPFWPGHTKWDYEISIVGDRPDIVAGLWRPTPEDRERIADAGYEVVQLRRAAADQLNVDYERQTQFLARRDSAEVDWSALEVVAG